MGERGRQRSAAHELLLGSSAAAGSSSADARVPAPCRSLPCADVLLPPPRRDVRRVRAGHVKRVRCESSAAMVPKDKAIKRFIVRNMVDASAIRDLQDACAIDGE